MASILDTFNELIKLEPVNKGFQNQIYAYHPILDLFQKGKAMLTVDGGDYIRVGLDYGEITGTHWSGVGQVFDPASVGYIGDGATAEVLGHGQYEWSFYNSKIRIPYRQWILIEKGVYTVEEYAKMLLDKAAKGVSANFEKILFTAYGKKADNSNDADANHKAYGLLEIIKDSGTLAGVDPTADAWWASPVYSYDADKSLTEQMFTIVSTLTYKWGKPTIIITTPTVYNKYCIEAYNKSGFMTKSEVATKLGFQTGAEFDGIPVVFTDAVGTYLLPEGTMLFINTDYLKFVLNPNAKFKISPFKQVSTYNYDYIAMLDATYSLICDNRQPHSKLSSIT